MATPRVRPFWLCLAIVLASALEGCGRQYDGAQLQGAIPASVAKPPGPAPAGMLWIPGGTFWMGTANEAFPDARPVHRVAVTPFWMDRTVVTNDAFARFVRATNYVTYPEIPPKAADFPNAPPENLVAGGVVFAPPGHPVPLDNNLRWWSYRKGANWRHPAGPASAIAGRGNYPVVQVAWRDAAAYCAWAHKRLPTEAEYEFAQRGGLDRKNFAWGDEFMPGGKMMANTFHGHFPDRDDGANGYKGISPVGAFPPNGYGLLDITGNVWEWTSDWYRPDYYATLDSRSGVAVNPRGPESGVTPDEPGMQERVIRGGSFLCTAQYCKRFYVGSRMKADPDTGTNHIGFRCVRDATVKKENA